MLIKIRYPNTVTVMISFVLTWWIINEFEKSFLKLYLNIFTHQFNTAGIL